MGNRPSNGICSFLQQHRRWVCGEQYPGLVLPYVAGACRHSRCSIYRLSCPLYPKRKGERGLWSSINFDVAQIHHTHVGDRSSLNDCRHSAAAAAWYCNLILVFWGGGRPERESRRGRIRGGRKRGRSICKKLASNLCFPLLWCCQF